MKGTEELGDIGELYSSLAGRLERIVRACVSCPDPVIEDACQFAWSRLLHHRDRVRRDTALGWLARTAVREAFRVTRRRARELPLEDEAGHPSGASIPRHHGTMGSSRYDSRGPPVYSVTCPPKTSAGRSSGSP